MRRSIYMSGTANKGHSGIGTSPVLEKYLLSLGYEISNSPESEFLISINHNPVEYKKFIGAGGTIQKAFLILLEPQSVYPAQFLRKNLNLYGLKISPGNANFNIENGFIGWPYTFNLNPSKPDKNDQSLESYISQRASENIYDFQNWKKRTIICAMIAANKVSPSKTNQYALRRYFAKNFSSDALMVFGPLWVDSFFHKVSHRLKILITSTSAGYLPNLKSIFGNLIWSYPTARGEIANKHEVLLNTKFSIVVENSDDYVSEKLLDCFINGSIPLYFGPKLKSVGLSNKLSINVDPKVDAIIDVIRNIHPDEIISILSAMKSFVYSEQFKESWSHDSVYKKIANFFDESIGKL